MKRWLFAFVSTLFLQIQAQEAPVGDWVGTLKVSGIELRLVFHITQNDSGQYDATLDSPDQGAKGIPVSSVTMKGDSIVLDVSAARARFEGVLNADPEPELNGVWLQSGQKWPLIMHPVTEADKIKRPQTPQAPFPYESEEVSYENPVSGYVLAGTLTRPTGAGPYPVALLITGSGAQDRDETIFEHKPFWVIADHLTRQGVAVLRVDDRGIGGSKGFFSKATTADFATDVEAGLDYLKTRPDIDAGRMGLIGHSEGGIIAPMVATRRSDVAFIVMLAGPGMRGDEILMAQSALIMIASGAEPKEAEENNKLQKALFEVIIHESDADSAAVRLKTVLSEFADGLTEEELASVSGKEGFVRAQLHKINNPWMRYFIPYDPQPALKQVKCPVLALFGDKDLQVPGADNQRVVETALKEGGNVDYETVLFESVNHLFQSCDKGLPAEYGRIEETMAPKVLEKMAQWITQRVL